MPTFTWEKNYTGEKTGRTFNWTNGKNLFNARFNYDQRSWWTSNVVRNERLFDTMNFALFYFDSFKHFFN